MLGEPRSIVACFGRVLYKVNSRKDVLVHTVLYRISGIQTVHSMMQ
jgi:hypothetical protein